MALGQQFEVPKQFVPVDDLDVGDAFNRRFQGQDIVVSGRPSVLATKVDDHQQKAGILDFPIGHSVRSQQFRTPFFEINEVVGVVEQPHPVGLGVSNPDLDLVMVRHRVRCLPYSFS